MNSVPDFDPMKFQAQALKLRSFRQEIIAGNLANSDTPGYRARDIGFDAELRGQMQGSVVPGGLAMVVSDVRHLGATNGTQAPELLYRTAIQPSVDDNTVDPDIERAHYAENTIGFEMATALLSATVRSRQMALTGQP
jgi:flagellar basal-body rod protein FlgB